MKILKLLFLICLLAVQGVLKAQTLHILVFCDTNDRNIGVNKESERKITINEMSTIADILGEYGYDSEMKQFSGNDCNKKNLISAVKNLGVTSNDVVFFYYGGHGSRAMNNDSDPFPQMCLGEDYQENWVPATLIKNMVMAKNPRLAIIMTGCCNKEDAGVTIKSVMSEAPYTKEADYDKSAYKKLFLDSKGLVMMTSSKAGQYSYSGSEGGVFCLNLWRVIEMVGKGEIMPDWETVCRTVKDDVAQVPIRTKDGIVHQEPFYQVTFSGSDPVTTTRHRTTITHTININNQNSSLSADINSLLDKTVDVDQRLILAQRVLQRHFATGAKVITKAKNMITNVDYEDAEAFLRRIVLSPYITHINVISEEGTGLKTQIVVHEIRTN